MISTLLVLCLAPLVVLGQPQASTNASTRGWIPDGAAANEFNAQAVAAGLYHDNTMAATVQSVNGSMGVSTGQAITNWGWTVFSWVNMGFSNVRDAGAGDRTRLTSRLCIDTGNVLTASTTV